MSPSIFLADHCLTVTTKGPGKLSLLTFKGATGLSNVVGAKTTTSPGQTRWLISFSHNYTRFAFIWEGAGEAVYRIGSSLLTAPVGTKWTEASLVEWWSGLAVKQDDVSSELGSALNRDNVTTFWAIPDPI